MHAKQHQHNINHGCQQILIYIMVERVYMKAGQYNNIFMEKMLSSNPEEILLPSTHFHKNASEPSPDPQNPVSNKNQIAVRLSQHTISHIQDEIMESKITLRSSHRNLLHQSPNKQSPSPPKLHEIVRKRKELQEEITRLQYQESRTKIHPQKSPTRKARSDFTKQEQQQIAKALQAKRQLQQEIAIKNQRLQQDIQQKMKQEEAQRKAKTQEICKEKQVKIAEHLRELQAKKEQREKEIKELNKNYQSVKGRTFLHEKMENIWHKQEQKHEAEDKNVLIERKKGKEFSMRTIIEHQKKYQTFVTSVSKQKQEKTRQTRLERELMERQVFDHYQPSAFLQTIFEQEKQLKLAELQRTNLVKMRVQTKTKYGDSIREINKELLEKKRILPSIRESQQDMGGDTEQSKNKAVSLPRTSKSMSRLEIAQIGNKYLREVHSSLSHTDPKQRTSKYIEPKQKNYQDYLQDLKRKRAEKPSNPELREISELKSVLKRNGNAEDKLYHAKLIAGRLEGRAKGDTDMLVSSINAKLAILDQFSN